MAVIWTESFETGDLVAQGSFVTPTNSQKLTPAGSFILAIAGVVTSSQRTGTQCGSGVYSVGLLGADQDDTIIAGCAFLGAPSSERILTEFWSDSQTTQHVTVTVSADRKIRAYRGSPAGTLLGTSAALPTFIATTYYYVEVKVKLSDTVGTVEVHVDEIAVLALGGLDTKNAGTMTVFDSVRFRGDFWSRLDDIYICNSQGSVNNDFLGAVKIEALLPAGNGNYSQGVGSDGNSVNNYQLVDEMHTVTFNGWIVDYVDLASTGDRDTYVYADSAQPTTRAVKAVMVWTAAYKTDAGARTLTPVARLAGTDLDGAVVANLVNGQDITFGVPFDTKPGGGSWTVNDVNNAEFGAKAS